ncbi:hypothetical protein NDU88_006857 [Pleurodeles waltl]|uniref:Uncharacterized protein n=1 Tax=Pleurodeles waltl TaxID=8319 RepID=A0AAV7PNM0_PLEWA|nr:hypothetical protein NDU88_006857 [Pleurodeles waltl]
MPEYYARDGLQLEGMGTDMFILKSKWNLELATGVEWEQAAERALRSVRRGLSPLFKPMRAHAQRAARSLPIEFSAREHGGAYSSIKTA